MGIIEQLLFRHESESLDFKRDQYPFAMADDRAKSELLKDILAFANSWRSEPAFILIGVDENPGSLPEVVGTQDHMDDAQLQQFVVNKTQKPLSFSYSKRELNGKIVGVIEVPVQQRPFYLKKDFGKLKANTVYIRRGSSTAEASPDEVAQMGQAFSGGETKIQLNFAAPETRNIIGSKIEIECVDLKVPPQVIPDFKGTENNWGIRSLERANTDYYRELADAAKKLHLVKKVSLTAQNDGAIAAHNVRAEFMIPDPDRTWEFLDEDDYPDEAVPERYKIGYLSAADIAKRMRRDGEPGVDIEYIEGTWHLSFEFGKLQPGRILWPSIIFCIGARANAFLKLDGNIMADNLPRPIKCELEVTAKAEKHSISLGDLVEIIENPPEK